MPALMLRLVPFPRRPRARTLISSRSIDRLRSPPPSQLPTPTPHRRNRLRLILHPPATPSLPGHRPIPSRSRPRRRLRSRSLLSLVVGQTTPIRRPSRTAATSLRRATRRDRRSNIRVCSRRIRTDPRCPSRLRRPRSRGMPAPEPARSSGVRAG